MNSKKGYNFKQSKKKVACNFITESRVEMQDVFVHFKMRGPRGGFVELNSRIISQMKISQTRSILKCLSL